MREWQYIITEFIKSNKDNLFEIAKYSDEHLVLAMQKKDEYLLKMSESINSIEIGEVYNEKISPILEELL